MFEQAATERLSFFELTAKIVGIAGPSFALLKSLITYAVDHSIARKATRTIEEIDLCLGRSAKLENDKIVLRTPEFDRYKQQLKEDLQLKLQALEGINARRLRRAAERNAEPKGIRRWLLLYRPEGFDGLLIQVLYYMSSFGVISSAVILAALLIVQRSLFTPVYTPLFMLVSVLIYALLALYCRSISLRLKSVGNVIRLRSIASPNSDIGWLRRNLLILKKGDGLWVPRLFYYFFLFAMICAPASSNFDLRSWEGTAAVGIVMLMEFILAQSFRVDALSRRANARLKVQAAA